MDPRSEGRIHPSDFMFAVHRAGCAALAKDLGRQVRLFDQLDMHRRGYITMQDIADGLEHVTDTEFLSVLWFHFNASVVAAATTATPQ